MIFFSFWSRLSFFFIIYATSPPCNTCPRVNPSCRKKVKIQIVSSSAVQCRRHVCPLCSLRCILRNPLERARDWSNVLLLLRGCHRNKAGTTSHRICPIAWESYYITCNVMKRSDTPYPPSQRRDQIATRWSIRRDYFFVFWLFFKRKKLKKIYLISNMIPTRHTRHWIRGKSWKTRHKRHWKRVS